MKSSPHKLSFIQAAAAAGLCETTTADLLSLFNRVDFDGLTDSFFNGLPCPKFLPKNSAPGAKIGYFSDGFYPESTFFAPAKAAFDKAHIRRESGFLAALIAIGTKTYELFQEYGLPEKIFFDGLKKIGKNAKAFYKEHGFWGIDDYVWLCSFLAPATFAVGSIECRICSYDYKKKCIGKTSINPGDPVIQVHIPDGADISRTSLERSYAKAYRLFGIDIFLVDSWLLYPPHMEVLDEDSAIRAFAKDYSLIEISETYNYEGIFRVFGKRDRYTADDLPQDTTLQRFYAARLRHHKPVGSAVGVMKFCPSKS